LLRSSGLPAPKPPAVHCTDAARSKGHAVSEMTRHNQKELARGNRGISTCFVLEAFGNGAKTVIYSFQVSGPPSLRLSYTNHTCSLAQSVEPTSRCYRKSRLFLSTAMRRSYSLRCSYVKWTDGGCFQPVARLYLPDLISGHASL